MTANKLKYYPNNQIKHKIQYYSDGSKFERFYVDYFYYNIDNPGFIIYLNNKKISSKRYYLNGFSDVKLKWMNKIKNI